MRWMRPCYAWLMGEDRAAMVFTDPPYNVPIDGHVSGKGKPHHREFAMAAGEMSEGEFAAFLTTVCGLMADVSRDGALHYLLHGLGPPLRADDRRPRGLRRAAEHLRLDQAERRHGLALPLGARDGGGLQTRAAPSHRNNVPLGRFGRNRTNVWAYAGANGFGRGEDADLTSQHPTPKPVAMIADAMLDVTARHDIVLDVFMGSGSTLIAAEHVGRRCRGIEMDPLYVDLTIRRWQRLTGDDAVRQDGMTFNTLIAQAQEAA